MAVFKYMDGQVPGPSYTTSPLSLVLLSSLVLSVLQPSASVAGYSYIPSVKSLPRFSSSILKYSPQRDVCKPSSEPLRTLLIRWKLLFA